MKKNDFSRYIAAVFLCIFSGIVVFLAEKNIENKFLDEIEHGITSLIKTTQSTLKLIALDNSHNILIAATFPGLLKQVNSLSTNKELAAEKNIAQLLQPFITIHGYLDYYIVTKNNIVLATSNPKHINLDAIDEKLPEFFQQIWNGKATMSNPFDSSLVFADDVPLSTEIPTLILLGSVIKDEDHNIIATLLITATPDKIYGKFLDDARIGDTGETYIINKDGLLLSSSRFENELQDKGLLTREEPSEQNIQLKGIYVVNDKYTEELIEINLAGYLDYRNQIVVGAKLWDKSLQLTIVSEIDKVQAYTPIRNIRRTTLFIFTIYCSLIFIFIYFFNKYNRELIISRERRKQSDLRLRLAFENNPSGNILADSKGIIMEFSKSAEHIFGYSSDELIGKNVTELMPEPHKSSHHNYLENYLNTGKENIIGSGGRNLMAIHKNGHSFPIHLSVGAIVINHEIHFIGSLTDQTKQQQIEKKLQSSQKMEAIGQLSSGIAHDFNNLLGIALGNLQLLQRKITANEMTEKHINSSIQALERGVNLTRQMLNFSRTSSSETAVVKLNDCIMEISKLIEQTATAKINLIFKLSEELNNVEINQGEFNDTLINLTANARDAMPDGGSLTIETSTCSSDAFTKLFGTSEKSNTAINIDYIVLSVIDTGEGIPKDNLDNIFEPFFTTKTRNKGTGLGLSMVYSFVKKSLGEIQVTSTIGVGSSFKLYLPLSKESPVETFESTEQPIVGGNESILLVDDEVELLAIAKTNLEDAGYTVKCATSGEQALEILQSNSIDFLLSDVIMPNGINGFELAVKSISLHPALKVAITSGFTDKTKKTLVEGNLLARYLADNLLPKPYDHNQLLKYVRCNLDKKILIEWTNELSIGVKAIDNDHKVLFDIVNKLHTLVANKIDPIEINNILEALLNYTSLHFRREEIIMEVCKFPHLDSQLKAHHQMEKQIKLLVEQSTSPAFDIEDINAMLRFLCAWLFHHVGKEDKQIADYTVNHMEAINEMLKKQSELFLDPIEIR